MRSAYGLLLAIFTGLLMLATIVVTDWLGLTSDLPTILIIIALAVIGIWAVTNADKLVISLTGNMTNDRKASNEEHEG